jgi:hypothetical protein
MAADVLARVQGQALVALHPHFGLAHPFAQANPTRQGQMAVLLQEMLVVW